MLEFPGGARAAIAMLLLLGACAGGAAPQATLSLPEPAAGVASDAGIAPDAGVAPDDGIPAAAAIPRSGGTEIGYLLLDLETGEELAALNPDLPLIPASTVKLATAVVALDVLGPEHRYRTELLTDGVARDGVLRGDLILKGGGDPSLDVADLLELAARLQASGVRSVEGRFLIDDTALPRLPEIEPTQPLEAAYNPGIGALSVAFNRVRVSLRGGASVMTLPPLDAQFEAAPSSLLPPGGVELKSADGDEVVWRVADRGGRRREIEIPVKDPGLHAGDVFRWLALAQGVYVGPPERGVAPSQATLLAVHESAPLRSLLRDTLLYSNNMMAEMIGLSAAGRLGDTSSGPDDAGRLLLRHLARLMPEVDWQGAVIGNCSGLDGSARLTPRQLAAIARYGWRTQALAALLPGGGWSGTLSNRFGESGEAMRVWAKTGTLNYGSALAGYLFPEVGRPAVFVTMVSDVGARAAYDAIVRPDRADEGTADVWNARARALEDELVEGWLEPLPTS